MSELGAPRRAGGNRLAAHAIVISFGAVPTPWLTSWGRFIGFGIAGQSQLVNGIAPRAALDSVRVDYAIANVALAVGLTALVTSIMLITTHH